MRFRALFEQHLEGFEVFSNGTQAQAFCPFHDDVGSSKKGFNVNLLTGKWYCYSCQMGGGVQKFSRLVGVKDYEPDVEYERLDGIEDLLRDEVKELKPSWLNYPEGFSFVTGKEDGVVGKAACKYLLDRGLTIPQIMRYRIGYCYVGRYKGRIIVPTLDEEERVQYFVARTFLHAEVPYLNPSNSIVRGKTEVLFNYQNARSMSQIVICEGVFDAIAVGPNAVAVFGKTISAQQANLLAEAGPKEVVVALDGDAYPQAMEMGQILASYGLEVRVARLPREADPASLNRLDLSRYLQEAKAIGTKEILEAKLSAL